MTPNAGILNIVLRAFDEQFVFGIEALNGDAIHLLSLLVVLELTIVALFWAFSGDESLGKFLKKVIFFAVFVGIINNYSAIVDLVQDSFVQTATKAAGASKSYIDDPSGIIDRGVDLVEPLFGLAQEKMTIMNFDIVDALFLLIAIVATLVAYAIIAFQVFITRIEFGLVSTLGFMLVPLAVFSKTSFMTEKIFGAVVSFGVKLMVLAFVLSVAFPIIENLSMAEEVSWYDQVYTAVASLAIAMLALHAPGVAAGLLAGSPALNAGSFVSGAAVVGAAPVAAVMGVAAVAKGAWAAGGAVVGGAKSATKAAAGAFGSMRGPGSGDESSGALSTSIASAGTSGGRAESRGLGGGQTQNAGATGTAAGATHSRGGGSASSGAASGGARSSSGPSNSSARKGDKAGGGLSRPEDYFKGDKSQSQETSTAARAMGAYQTGSAALQRQSQPSGSNVVPINGKQGEE